MLRFASRSARDWGRRAAPRWPVNGAMMRMRAQARRRPGCDGRARASEGEARDAAAAPPEGRWGERTGAALVGDRAPGGAGSPARLADRLRRGNLNGRAAALAAGPSPGDSDSNPKHAAPTTLRRASPRPRPPLRHADISRITAAGAEGRFRLAARQPPARGRGLRVGTPCQSRTATGQSRTAVASFAVAGHRTPGPS